MRVEPELRDHPKFLRLKKIVGEGAMEYLMALWSHCQSNQRGEFWPGADANYVEMICRWDGEEGVLFKALTECGKPGFVVAENDGMRIHDWEEMNSQTVHNWNRNRLGRNVRKPTDNPRTTHGPEQKNYPAAGGSKGGSGSQNGQPTDNPRLSIGHNQSEASVKPINTLSLYPINPDGCGENYEPSTRSTQTLALYDQAKTVLSLLNELTGAKFSPTIPQLDQIVSCHYATGSKSLEMGEILKMVRRQCALWKDDPTCKNWLRPATLFGPKFADYFGQRDLPLTPPAPANTSAQRKKLQDCIDRSPANPKSVYHSATATEAQREQLKKWRAELRELEGVAA